MQVDLQTAIRDLILRDPRAENVDVVLCCRDRVLRLDVNVIDVGAYGASPRLMGSILYWRVYLTMRRTRPHSPGCTT